MLINEALYIQAIKNPVIHLRTNDTVQVTENMAVILNPGESLTFFDLVNECEVYLENVWDLPVVPSIADMGQ